MCSAHLNRPPACLSVLLRTLSRLEPNVSIGYRQASLQLDNLPDSTAQLVLRVIGRGTATIRSGRGERNYSSGNALPIPTGTTGTCV